MPVKIRLQRHGKKGKPFYWIVAADGRAKRDGKYLEKLGTYNPNVNPAEINLDIDGAVRWLQNGAQPTDTARNILSYKGAMLKKHLAGGVKKGALSEEEAEKKFNTWLEEKEKAIETKRTKLSDAKKKAEAEALAAEKAINEKRAADATEEATEEVAAEAPAIAKTEDEAPKKETIDDVAAEAAKEGTPAANAEDAVEVAEEAPAADAEASKEEE
jgi:small subunit ribosomal protein S16